MFSLRMLMAVVAISAVYIAGMVYRTPWWEAGIQSLTYTIYAAALTAAILSRERRAFFVAFAVFGLAYFWFRDRIHMVTTQALEELTSKMQPEFVERGPADPFRDVFESHIPLKSIAHSFFAVLISLLAGVIAEAVVRRRQKLVT